MATNFAFHDINKEICLTCQYFRTEREIKFIGRSVVIMHNGQAGKCSLFNNFPKVYTCTACKNSFCHYKSWIELPD